MSELNLRSQAEKMLAGGGDSPEWSACQAVARAYLKTLSPPAPGPGFDAEGFCFRFSESVCKWAAGSRKEKIDIDDIVNPFVAELRSVMGIPLPPAPNERSGE